MTQKEYPLKTHITNVRDKNSGTIYVEERIRRYEPEKAAYVLVKSTRIGKRDPLTNEIGPCRPTKRKPKAAPAAAKETPAVTTEAPASRKRTSGITILEKVSKASGLEAAIHDAYPLATAQKLTSVAQYLAMTNEPMNRIEPFQLERDLAYKYGISSDMCYALFDELGIDEARMHRFFSSLIAQQPEQHVLAFDSTTIGAYSKQIDFAGQGVNKDGDELDAIKLVTFYSLERRIPLAFEMIPGNVSDVSTLMNAVKRAKSYGFKNPEFVVDNGYTKKENLRTLLENNVKFTGVASLQDNFVREILESEYDGYENVKEALNDCPLSTNDFALTGLTIMKMVEFEKVRKVNSKNGSKGEVTKKPYRLYFHFFRDCTRATNELVEYKRRVTEIKNALLSGERTEEELTPVEQKMFYASYETSRLGHGGALRCEYKRGSNEKIYKGQGIFCIVSNTTKDTIAALQTYRMRNRIEANDKVAKTDVDGKCPRMSSMANMRGKELCRMVALGYHFYLQVAINNIKAKCETCARDSSLSKADQNKYEKLGNWLKKTPLRVLLKRFDRIETKTTNKFSNARLNPEIIKRDALFLEMLDQELANPSYTDARDEINIPGEQNEID